MKGIKVLESCILIGMINLNKTIWIKLTQEL